VPDHFLNLLPPDVTKPKVSSPTTLPRGRTAPKFGAPDHLIADKFWSNLRYFLFERPVKLGPARPGTPFRSANYSSSVLDNLKDFFRSTPAVARTGASSRLEVNWGAGFGSFGQRLKEVFFPAKLPPLRVTSKAVRVKEIWSKRENFGRTQTISIVIHGALLALLLLPLMVNVMPTSTQANTKMDVVPIDFSPYVSKLPAGADKAGGGGGGGDRSKLPPTKGRVPKFTWTQFTPPSATIKNPQPKLPMDPSLLGPPELKVSNPALTNYGDPLAAAVNMSNGPGGGGGIGTGEGGGIGSGSGARHCFRLLQAFLACRFEAFGARRLVVRA